MTKHGERCETCCYWSTKGMATCRRHAPRVTEAPGQFSSTPNTEWPHTNHDDWCGDWQAQHDFIAATRPA